MTKMIAATASTRKSRIKYCRSFDSPLFIFCAIISHIIAAHFTCRRRNR